MDAPHGWLPTALRRLEHKLGAQRDDRTLWVWTVPAATVVVTFVVLAFVGMQGRVDLLLTVPMALVLAAFLGSLSAFYLTAASSDERDADEGPDDHRRPQAGPPDSPPPPAARVVVRAPPQQSPDADVQERAPAAAGGPARR